MKIIQLCTLLLLVFSRLSIASESVVCNTPDYPPLPNDILITASNDAPKKSKGFLGIWNGSWGDGQLCSTIVVTSISKKGGTNVIYSWGTSDYWNITKAGYVSAEGKAKRKKLRFQVGEIKVLLELKKDYMIGRFDNRADGKYYKFPLDQVTRE